MLRGFRWQLFALVVSAGIFMGMLLSRPSANSFPTPPPTETALPPTQSPPVPTAVMLSTPVTTTPTSYREALVGTVERINPLFSLHNPNERDLVALIFEGLTATNDYGETVGALASNWVIDSTYTEYVFTLRGDVLWQDGTPFTARDVAFTIGILQQPSFTGEQALHDFWKTIEVQVLDDTHLRFRLVQPIGNFLDHLLLGILPQHVFGEMDASAMATHPFNLSPIGTGRYQFAGIKGNDTIQQIELVAAPTYRNRPNQDAPFELERLTFHLFPTADIAKQALLDGKVDGLGLVESERISLVPHTQFNLNSTTLPHIGMIVFNWESGIEGQPSVFREAQLRQALQRALDRTAIVGRNLYQTAVLTDWAVPLGSWMMTHDVPNYPTYNPSESLRLIQTIELYPTPPPTDTEAVSADVTPETPPTPTVEPRRAFRFVVIDEAAYVNMATEISQQWSAIGFNSEVIPLSPDEYRNRLSTRDWDIAIVEYQFDPTTDLYSFWDEGSFPNGQNMGGVANRDISEALEAARSNPYSVNRKIYYGEFQRVFVAEAIALPLYAPLYTYATSKTIEVSQLGYLGSLSDRFRHIQSWRIVPQATP